MYNILDNTCVFLVLFCTLPVINHRKILYNGDTVIRLPVTEDFNGVGSRVLACDLSKMLAPTLYVLAIMALLCHACGRGFEQQDLEELRTWPTEWKSSEFLFLFSNNFACVYKGKEAQIAK